MKEHYNFSQGKRGAVVSTEKKERITIRLDSDIIHWFKDQAHHMGGGNYQTLINKALHSYIENQEESLENILRRVIREELKHKKTG